MAGVAQPSLARPSALAIAAGAATVLPGFLVGSLALQIRADLDVSVGAVAAGVTVFFAAGAVGAGPGGRLGERAGALRTIRGCVIGTAAVLLLVAVVAQSLAILLGLLAVAGLALPLGWRATFAICAGAVLAVAAVVGRAGSSFAAPPERARAPRPSRKLVITAVGAALASSGPSALGAYLVASAVDVGIAEGAAGVLSAAGSASSLVVRILVGHRADRRRDYGFSTMVALLVAGAGGFALLAVGQPAPFVAGVFVAFALGWGWPGLFNLAVVDLHREAPGAATGISQSGIYVGAAIGPAAYGLLSSAIGYAAAWAVAGALSLVAAVAVAWAARAPK